jgi:hypothetical protein
MPSGFYRTADPLVGKEPQRAVDIVTGVTDPKGLKANLIEALYYPGQSAGIFMPNDTDRDYAWPDFCHGMAWGGGKPVALLMNGTTSELQGMLRVAKVEGMEGLESTGDCLLIWYLRRKAGDETKSLVLIAPKYKFLGVGFDDPARNFDYKSKKGGWRFMGVSKHQKLDANYTGLSLSWLIQEALPQGEGVTAWW